MNVVPTRKSIQPLDAIDLGGIQPRAEELVSKEVVGYLNTINMNSKLLSDDDPLKEEYSKFLSNLGNSPIIISNADIDLGAEASYFDDVDLSENNDVIEDSIVIDNNFYLQNRLWASGPFGSPLYAPNAFIDPMSLILNNIQANKFKACGMVIETIPVNHVFDPFELTSKPSLVLVK